MAFAQVGRAATIGDDAISRANFDSYSDFSMALLGVTVPTGPNTLSQWQTYIGSTSGGNQMALLFLAPVGGNDYVTKFVDERTVVDGLNTFTASAVLQPGWLMGIWMGGGKVDFDYTASNNTTYTGDTALGSAPALNQTISYTGAITDRIYSIQATVPEGGATVALLGAGLAGIAFARRSLKA